MAEFPLHIADPKVDAAALAGIVEPIAYAHGLAVLEVSLRREQPGWILRVTVENPTTVEPGFGVTLDVCAECSRDLSHALDAEDLVPFPYTLEVGTPGVERPLRSAAEFARFQGKRAKVVLRRPTADGQRALIGEIQGVSGAIVSLDVDGHARSFDEADLDRAHLVFDFGPKRPKRRPATRPSAKKPKQDDA